MSMWWDRKYSIFFFTPSLIFIIFFPKNAFSSSEIHILNETTFVTNTQTLVSSPLGTFKLRFFSPWGSNRYYIGIWYTELPDYNQTFVWVANRDKPLSDSPGVFKIQDNNIVLLDQNQTNQVWSSNITKGKNTYAELLDTGNLVLREKGDPPNSKNYLWQSFDFPTDTLLPGMKLGRDPNTGLDRYLTSWSNSSDPVFGSYSVKLNDSGGVPEIYIYNNEIYPVYRSGQWNWHQNQFNNIPNVEEFQLITVTNGENNTFPSRNLLYSPSSSNHRFRRLTVQENGVLKSLYWDTEKAKWEELWHRPDDECDKFGRCGPNGVCKTGTNLCKCLIGFNPNKWWARPSELSYTDPCARTIESCSSRDKFLRFSVQKLPANAILEKSSGILEDCEDQCKKNCSCTAYASYNPWDNSTIMCAIWVDELRDMNDFGYFSPAEDLYIRVSASELDKKRLKKILKTTGIIASGIITILILAFFSWKLIPKYREWKRKIKEMQLFQKRKKNLEFPGETLGDRMHELPIFSFEELATATNNFDPTNQIGKGGFGPVFKGTLPNGQEIAVKRLSSASGQGIEEFMNEALVVSKVQHRNLVRLLGCCVDHEEKILVYEYMPNKSLDVFLFGRLDKECLDWRTRFSITEGISRGLLYLHRDSRLRIIHRDLKAANILLDEKLNPKISDFGMARIFRGDQDEVNTRRVMGTYGYMSPEYAMKGIFSEKSDVFSFGVILLEIVSGRKNTSFYNDEHYLSLVEYAWKLWNGGNILDMVDKAVSDPCNHGEALRCIHVGLLCVQDFAEDRPAMSKVISMLNSEIVDLPPPKQPAFVEKPISSVGESTPMNENKCHSTNDVTITNLHGR